MAVKQLEKFVIEFYNKRRVMDNDSFRQYLNEPETQENITYIAKEFDKLVKDIMHFSYYIQDLGDIPPIFENYINLGKQEWIKKFISDKNIFYKIENYEKDFAAGLRFILLLNIQKFQYMYKDKYIADPQDGYVYWVMDAYRGFSPHEILNEDFSLKDFKFIFGNPKEALLKDVFYHELRLSFFPDEPNEKGKYKEICDKLNVSPQFLFHKIAHMDYDDFYGKNAETNEESNRLSMN